MGPNYSLVKLPSSQTFVSILPATNAFSECSFSAMRRIKTYLRSTTGQERLNHLMLLNFHKEKLDDLDLVFIANQFVSGSEHRLNFLVITS